MTKTHPAAIKIALTYTGPHAAEPYCASWTDGATRCHVWLAGVRSADSTIHRNTPTGETHWNGDPKTRHTTANLFAKSNAGILAAIRAIPLADFKAARDRHDREEEAKRRAEEEERTARELQTLCDLAAKHGFQLVAK